MRKESGKASAHCMGYILEIAAQTFHGRPLACEDQEINLEVNLQGNKPDTVEVQVKMQEGGERQTEASEEDGHEDDPQGVDN